MAGPDEEDDYMSMTFADPVSAKKENSVAKAARLKREGAERGRVLSRAERQKQDEERLNTKLDASNKGAQLMAKMGFAGGALGAVDNKGRENPIEVSLKLDRGGIGADSEKKRKIREEAEAKGAAIKRAKVTEDEYKERSRVEREEARAEGQWRGAMKVLESLEEQESTSTRPLSSVNLLYRPLERDRREAEARRRDLKSLYDDRKTLHKLGDPDMDDDDHLAIADDVTDLHEPDEALEQYEQLSATERLAKVVSHLREALHYCFWCKYRYEDATMDGCPGLTEDEHG